MAPGTFIVEWIMAPHAEDAMATFVFQLIDPHPSFAQHMTHKKRDVIALRASRWKPQLDSEQMVVLGPVLDGTASWALGVAEADDEKALR